MQNKKTILIISTILLFSIIPLISAYNFYGYDYFYGSPLDFLENQWVLFSIIFIILFGVIYYVLNKSFKNTGIAAAVGIGLSLFISMAIAQKGLLSQYGGGELSSWALLIASLITIAFLIRFVHESFGKIGLISFLVLLWIIIRSIDPYEILPNVLLTSKFYEIYDFIFLSESATVYLFIILSVLAIIIAISLINKRSPLKAMLPSGWRRTIRRWI